MARVNSEEGLTEITVDSGSDITLISHNFWSSMKKPPKEKSGQKINLIQVTGRTSITGYVVLELTFPTKDGPVKMQVEAYVVKGMKVPIILGNDFTNQYRISIDRLNTPSRIIFGFRPDFKSNLERRAFRRRKSAKRKNQSKRPGGAIPVKLEKDVYLKPESLTRVAVLVDFSEDKKKEEKVPPPTEEEIELSKQPEGGPKTAELPDPEHIPKDRLVAEINWGDTLTPEQKKALEKVVLKHHKALD
ncbi:Transposon Ty3-G Gag-Pol polyprotein [Ceratobasidium sp. AG-Ba]|nr:Transposon Ty3-G Gag-Pol polyprotein [Ceratobasidium sp. AG-Ba]